MEILTETKIIKNGIMAGEKTAESNEGSSQKSVEDVKTLFGILPNDIDDEKVLEERRNNI